MREIRGIIINLVRLILDFWTNPPFWTHVSFPKILKSHKMGKAVKSTGDDILTMEMKNKLREVLQTSCRLLLSIRMYFYIDPAIPSSRTNGFHLMYFYMYSLHKMTRLHEHIILEISVYNILL